MKPFAPLLVLLLCAPLATAQELPLERLSKTDRAEVQRVTRDSTVDASVPTQRVRCRPQVYRYLLNRLPLASRWLRALNLGDYDIREAKGGGFTIDDKAGATATCRRALDDADQLIVVASGKLDVSVLPTIRGTGVIVVRYAATESKTPELKATADVAFRVQSGFLHVVSRPFRRTLRKVLADKMGDLIRSATALAEAIQKDPAGTYAKLKKAGVSSADLEAFRERFLAL